MGVTLRMCDRKSVVLKSLYCVVVSCVVLNCGDSRRSKQEKSSDTSRPPRVQVSFLINCVVSKLICDDQN